jgi:hypothetical protein
MYAVEITRLRSAGYTYEAIREALAEVGVELSTSTLRREVRRLQMLANSVAAGPQPASQTPAKAATPPSSTPPPCPLALGGSSSRETAEAFFNAHPSNPLLRTKELP